MLEELPIRDPWVQDMLWTWSNPAHVRWDYTKLDMMKLFETRWTDGSMGFFGDKGRGVLLRTEIYNPKVIGVHIMGNGLAIRSVLKEGMVRAFKDFTFDVIELWTFDKRLISIQSAAGFRIVAEVPKRVYIDGEMRDVTVMQYTRTDYERDCRLAYRRLHPDEGEVET